MSLEPNEAAEEERNTEGNLEGWNVEKEAFKFRCCCGSTELELEE